MKYILLFSVLFATCLAHSQILVEQDSSGNNWFSQGWGAQEFGDEPVDPVDLYLGTPDLHALPEGVQDSGSLSDELESLFEYTHDALYMGGNITGGGESVLNLGAYTVDSLLPNEKNCQVNESILLDLVAGQLHRADTFKTHKKEKWLKFHFTDDELIYGARLDLRKSAPTTVARLEALLREWDKDSPIFTKLMRQKLLSTQWRVTNLPLKNPISDNIDLMTLIPTLSELIGKCYEAGLYDPQSVRRTLHETAASYRPGYGVLLSNIAWSRLGDDSRIGLIVHELLRSFQYGDLFPFSNAQIRRLVLGFIYASPKANDHKLDQLLLTHWMPSLGSAYITKEDRLKLACGVDKGNESWIKLSKASQSELLNKFEVVADQLPDRSHLQPKEKDLKGSLNVRLALVFQKLVERFGVEEIRDLIQAGKASPWFHMVDPAALDRSYYRAVLKEYKELRAEVCANPRFDQKGIEEFFGTDLSDDFVADLGGLSLASAKQQDFMKAHDNLITIYKLLNPDWKKTKSQSLHPNIYLPVVDHELGYLNRLIQSYTQYPKELSQVAIMVESNFNGSLDRFIKINQEFLIKLMELKRPPMSFNQEAYHFSDN